MEVWRALEMVTPVFFPGFCTNPAAQGGTGSAQSSQETITCWQVSGLSSLSRACLPIPASGWVTQGPREGEDGTTWKNSNNHSILAIPARKSCTVHSALRRRSVGYFNTPSWYRPSRESSSQRHRVPDYKPIPQTLCDTRHDTFPCPPSPSCAFPPHPTPTTLKHPQRPMTVTTRP